MRLSLLKVILCMVYDGSKIWVRRTDEMVLTGNIRITLGKTCPPGRPMKFYKDESKNKEICNRS